jgi:hypothetical protein
MVASPWSPHESLVTNGALPLAIYWAALDCPGVFSLGESRNLTVLGRMAAEVCGSVSPGERCTVIGWPIESEGRKHYAGTAIFNDQGEVVAKAFQTWIEVKSE